MKFTTILKTGSIALVLCYFSFAVKKNTVNRYFQKVQSRDTVIIEGMEFKPSELKVGRGTQVVFINKGFVNHDVTEKDKKWASPVLKPGDHWEKTIKGDADYYCSIHEVMKGKVTVK